MHSEAYGSCPMCVCVCVCVCVSTTILELQATMQLMSSIKSVSSASAQKI